MRWGGTLFGALALALVLSGCKEDKPRPPPRPRGVPPDAVWAGGIDGGVFIRCTPKGESTAQCTVWFDRTDNADVWMKGWFRLVPGTAGPRDLRAPLRLAGADGESIYLDGDARLEVIAPPRPAKVPPEAHWSGGPACGSFMACAKKATGFVCTVYDEDDGTVRSRGPYTLLGDEDEGPRSNDDLEESCAVKEWHILVRRGGLLVPATSPEKDGP